MLKQPDALDDGDNAGGWGGVYTPPPFPVRLKLALFNFDASTGALLSKVALQGSAIKELFFLRYV